MAPLDDPVWHALCGPQATLAEGSDGARRYPEDVAPFGAVADPGDPDDWRALAHLVGPGNATVYLPAAEPSDGWTALHAFRAHQMVLDDDVPLRPCDETTVEELTPSDLDEMTALVAATEPGPWRRRTHELGAFLGVRVDGRLVAMAGQRMQLADACEISAVCTDPRFRGAGHARRLVQAHAARIRATGRQPFLHVVVENEAAIHVYEQLGFRIRVTLRPTILQAPAH